VCPDAGGDAARDGAVGAHSVAEYQSFTLAWMGFGVSEDFSLDRDCLLTASISDGPGGPREGTGTVGATDCQGFKALVTSPDVLAGLADPSTYCAPATDDYSTFTLKWVDGQSLARTAGGCTHAKPFSAVRAEIHRLEVVYAPATWPDAGGVADGGDAALAGDAPDGG
jgi:hypothetical protein